MIKASWWWRLMRTVRLRERCVSVWVCEFPDLWRASCNNTTCFFCIIRAFYRLLNIDDITHEKQHWMRVSWRRNKKYKRKNMKKKNNKMFNLFHFIAVRPDWSEKNRQPHHKSKNSVAVNGRWKQRSAADRPMTSDGNSFEVRWSANFAEYWSPISS